jgi:serine/threonine-protein phosphatase 2A activator
MDRHPAAIELIPYLIGGFGDKTRIDYGSGHELSFVGWLCCLELLGLFDDIDHQAIVTRVFQRYLQLVRKLQHVYNLEPAGSHGVWGLDDYQFLPYFWVG